ncbi:MAG: phosphatase PAP2 family protein [Burkholderiales bacterium]|jgi:undecaprenyl-diphosphatase
MSALLQFDRTAFAWINSDWSNPVFDAAMPWITHIGDGVSVWPWIVFTGALLAWQLARSMESGPGKGRVRPIMQAAGLACLCMASIYGVNAAAYTGLKHLSQRSRPFTQQAVVLRVSPATASALGNDTSFPSGHTANAFMLAALLAERLRRKRYYLYGMAVLVGFSRIYLGVHYPGDVLAGGALGWSITRLMLQLRPLRDSIAREHLLLPHT